MAEYIEREAAINTMKNAQFEYTSEEAAEFISHIPAADVAPVRHGRWLYDEGDIVCSECDGIVERNIYSYCPWCGADMRKGDE